MDISYRTIGQNIRKARKAQNLTQEQVAERVHLSTLHYGRIERGEHPVSIKQLAQIGSALHTPFESFLANCILDKESYSAVLETTDDHSVGYAEYALILLDQYREQLKAHYQELKQEDVLR